MTTPEQLLIAAEGSEEGRRALFALCQEAKDCSMSATFLALNLHKYARNSDFDCSTFRFDSADERLIYMCLRDAQQALAQARELVTERMVAATKALSRD